jgi:UDP-2,3-diacylglucosamine pyrophosphatase LpxH
MRYASLGRLLRRLLSAAVFAAALAEAGKVHAESDHYTVIISDTHFGVGRDKSGAWDAYEDARWEGDFEKFLTYVADTGGGKAHLIINGDAFELWQSRDVPCAYADKDAGCSEADALLRLKNVFKAHDRELELLKQFASTADNRLTIVVGNHDVALLLPAVKAELFKTFAVPGCRFTFEQDGVWESQDGKVRAEHGHQIGEDPNAFAGWPNPFMQLNGQTHVRRPWGEKFVQDFYNQFETKYPVIDNMTDELKAARLGLQMEGVRGSAQGMLEFLKFVALRESWSQAKQILGGDSEGSAPWNIAKERAKGAAFLEQSFPKGDIAQLALASAGRADADAFVRDKARLTDAEIVQICDIRASRGAVLSCARPLSSVASSALTIRDTIFKKYLGSLKKPPRVFVYSHTHLAESFDITNPDVQVFNSGAWQRLITPERVRARATNGKKPEDVLRRLVPEDLEACYSFVGIAPYSGAVPKAQLLSFRVDKEHAQGVSGSKRCH